MQASSAQSSLIRHSLAVSSANASISNYEQSVSNSGAIIIDDDSQNALKALKSSNYDQYISDEDQLESFASMENSSENADISSTLSQANETSDNS